MSFTIWTVTETEVKIQGSKKQVPQNILSIHVFAWLNYEAGFQNRERYKIDEQIFSKTKKKEKKEKLRKIFTQQANSN